MKVVVFSAKKFEIDYINQSNKGKHELTLINESLSVDTADLAKGHQAVSIFTNDDGSATVLKKLMELGVKNVAIRAAGVDSTDLKAAAELKFHVGNVPEYSPYSIAEHTIAMIQALNRKIVPADTNVKNYNFCLDDLIGFDLNGKTVGIVGVGKIGGILARILHGFGCRVLGFDIEEKQEYKDKFGVKYVSFEELCKQSDIISLHAPLNEHTKYMINKETIGQMKMGVMIINTGRGGLLNTPDALEGVKSGKIGFLGLDVYEKEKGVFFYDRSKNIPEDSLFAELLKFKNVLITGHQAFLTENALRNIADTTIYNLDCWEKGEKSKNDLIN